MHEQPEQFSENVSNEPWPFPKTSGYTLGMLLVYFGLYFWIMDRRQPLPAASQPAAASQPPAAATAASRCPPPASLRPPARKKLRRDGPALNYNRELVPRRGECHNRVTMPS